MHSSMRLTRLLAAAIVIAAASLLSAQGTTFQFYVSASNQTGAPVTDLRTEDVLMSEKGVQQQVVKIEPVSIPIKLTIAVDNGVDSGDALVHYRSGLTGLVEALPADVEVTLITIAPQPRVVVNRPHADRERHQRVCARAGASAIQ